jgi:hypothetical protein
MAARGASALDMALAVKTAPKLPLLGGPELLLDGLATIFSDSYEQVEISEFVERARNNQEEVSWLSYLTLRERFDLVRALELGERLSLDLGSEQEHVCVITVRNDIAHGRPVKSGTLVIEALAISERLLDVLVAR